MIYFSYFYIIFKFIKKEKYSNINLYDLLFAIC